MTQITTGASALSPYAAPVNVTTVVANNGVKGSDGTQTTGVQASGSQATGKAHHGHHHHGSGSADSSDNSSFSALMNLLGSSSDDDTATNSDPVSSLLTNDSPSTASPLLANEVGNAASANDAGASTALQALRHYTTTDLPSSPDAAVNQSI
jgi:hypothetical protein